MDGTDTPRSSVKDTIEDKKPLTWKDGLRLVDLYELAKQMHCKTCTLLLDLNNTKNETRWGFASVLSILCCGCQTLNDIYTGKVQETEEGKTVFEINVKASVNMLLCGDRREHVINFLAVLNIPEPTPHDTSVIISSTLDSSASVPVVDIPCEDVPRDMSTSLTSFGDLPQAVTGPSLQEANDQSVSNSLVFSLDGIKKEENEELPKSRQTCSPKTFDDDAQKTTRGKKRKAERTADDLIAVETEQEEPDEFEEVGFDDTKDKVTSVTEAKAVQRKRYKCPHCGKILPSSRGFHIHVGRMHQASNLQAVHYELGKEVSASDDEGQLSRLTKQQLIQDSVSHHQPDPETSVSETALPVTVSQLKPKQYVEVRFSSGKKNELFIGKKSVGEDAVLVPSSESIHTTPTQQTLSTSVAKKKNCVVEKSHVVTSHSVSGASAEAVLTTGEENLDTTITAVSSQPDPSTSTKVGRLSKRFKSSKKVDDAKIFCRIRNCDQIFQTESLYQKHLQKVHGIDSPFACSLCTMQYNSQKSLNIHMTVAHRSKDERKAVCKYCGDTVQHRRALKKHIKAYHPRGAKKTFYCDECPMTFPQPSALKNHKLKHAGIKNYQCFYCEKRFSGSGNRLNHMRYFHEKERKFLCDTCGASFYRAYSLREHERVHSGEKPYQCERCAERFTKKEYLTIHMRTHTGEKPYKCELCDKAFSQRTSRSIHRRKVHGMKKQESSNKKALKEVRVDNKIVFVSSA